MMESGHVVLWVLCNQNSSHDCGRYLRTTCIFNISPFAAWRIAIREKFLEGSGSFSEDLQAGTSCPVFFKAALGTEGTRQCQVCWHCYKGWSITSTINCLWQSLSVIGRGRSLLPLGSPKSDLRMIDGAGILCRCQCTYQSYSTCS